MSENVRIDKWLWSVRVFKSRSQATEACKSGKVKIDGQVVKPSREVKEGDVVTIGFTQFAKTVQVRGLIENRVSAKIAAEHMEDLTPQEEYDKIKKAHELNYEYRKKGLGRPTKKQRRLIDKLKKNRD